MKSAIAQCVLLPLTVVWGLLASACGTTTGATDAAVVGTDGGPDAGANRTEREESLGPFVTCGQLAQADGGSESVAVQTPGGGCGAREAVAWRLLGKGVEGSWPASGPEQCDGQTSCSGLRVLRFDDADALAAHPRHALLTQHAGVIDFAAESLLLVASCSCPSTAYEVSPIAVERDGCLTHVTARFTDDSGCGGGGGAITWPWVLLAVPASSPAHACGETTATFITCWEP